MTTEYNYGLVYADSGNLSPVPMGSTGTWTNYSAPLDTTNSFDAETGEYEIKIPGKTFIKFVCSPSVNSIEAATAITHIYRNGSKLSRPVYHHKSSGFNVPLVMSEATATVTMNLHKGDIITARTQYFYGGAIANVFATNNAVLEIVRLS